MVECCDALPPLKQNPMRTRRNEANSGRCRIENQYAIELVYRIQLLRLAFGFSQAELSFLLGYPTNRVRCIEDFSQGHRYALQDLLNLTHIFECPTIRFLPQGQIGSASTTIRTERRERDGKCVHEAWQCTGNADWELLWKLPERMPECRPAAEPAALLDRTRTLIRSLIAGGYFNNPWETFEIFKACRHTIGNRLRPLTLKYALLSFTGGEKQGLLQARQNGDHQVWVATRSNEAGYEN